jgi:crotonobetainyl-CoA:carnitine CoA-transferase CaiB-like acyl-CoA transferase
MGPLEGYRVLELSTGPAAAFAGLLLRFMGADVEVVEPEGGSPLRNHPPFAGGESMLFAYLSAGKRMGSGDPHDQGLEGVHVVLHDADLSARMEALLETSTMPPEGRAVVACTPYGIEGPKRSWSASELTLFQAGGEGYLMPHGLPFEECPDGPPIGMGRYVAHYQGGTAAAGAAVAALRQSRLMGRTARVDVAIQDAQVSLNYFTVSRYVEGVRETRATRAFKYAGLVRCLDGYVEIVPLEQHQWEGLREMLGNPEWAFAEGLQDHVSRGRHGEIVNKHLRAWTAERTVSEVVRLATDHGIPCGPYIAPEDLPKVEQLGSREYFIPPPDGMEWAHGFPGPAWVFDRWGKVRLSASVSGAGEGQDASA